MRFSFLYLLYFNKKGHVLCNSTRDCFYITIQIDLISVQVSWCLVLMESFVCKILLPLRILPQWNTWGSNQTLYIYVDSRYRKWTKHAPTGHGSNSSASLKLFLKCTSLCSPMCSESTALLYAVLFALFSALLDARIRAKTTSDHLGILSEPKWEHNSIWGNPSVWEFHKNMEWNHFYLERVLCEVRCR